MPGAIYSRTNLPRSAVADWRPRGPQDFQGRGKTYLRCPNGGERGFEVITGVGEGGIGRIHWNRYRFGERLRESIRTSGRVDVVRYCAGYGNRVDVFFPVLPPSTPIELIAVATRELGLYLTDVRERVGANPEFLPDREEIEATQAIAVVVHEAARNTLTILGHKRYLGSQPESGQEETCRHNLSDSAITDLLRPDREAAIDNALGDVRYLGESWASLVEKLLVLASFVEEKGFHRVERLT